MLKYKLLIGLVTGMLLGTLLSYSGTPQEKTGRGWELNYSADVAAQSLMKSVVLVETRFDKPRNDDKYAPWAWFRRGRPLKGLYGSGFIYKDPRYVITVPTILDNAEYVRVVTWDGKSYPATIKGKDDVFKTAVLEVEWGKYANPTPAKLGDSDKLRVGEPIAILGRSETGRDFVSTVGVISAIRKEIPTVEEPTEQYLQFDAAYSLYMIGGPLANSRGEVIGIVYGTVVDFFAMNINLAVPINEVVRVADKIIAGKAERPWFGAETIFLTSQIRSLNRIPEWVKQGMFISYVEPGSPADLAGLKPGDVILALDDKQILRSFDFSAFMRRVEIGQLVTVKYWRFTEGISDNPSMAGQDIYETVVQILAYPEEESEKSGSTLPPGHP